MERSLTQTQLADRLGWVQERISVIENGKYGMPSLQALVRLTEVLEVPFGELLDAAGYPEAAASFSRDGTRPAAIASQYALQRLLSIDATTLSVALNEASDLLTQTMGADKVDAFIYDASNESLVALGTSNTPMGRRQHQLGLDREPLANGGRTVEVYQSGRSYYTPHADEDPGMPTGVVQALGVRSFFAVPLRSNSEVIGVLAAESAQPDRFSEEECQFFEAAARWVAMLAHRAELTESLTQAAADDARRLAAEELVTLLAHDLGNALTPMKGRLELLTRRFGREGRERDLKDAEDITRSVRRLQRMVTELLDVARIDQGLFALAPQTVDLVALVDEVVGELRSATKEIEVRLPDELSVQADPVKINQALENLVSNAISHAPDGVPIVIGAGTEKREDGTWAVVSVHDEGPGISPEVMPQLFTRFAAGPDSNGLGLGLYLARSITEAHGGTLNAESAAGKGTSFWLSLPLAPTKADGVPETPA
jgi:two-component system, OmpR family, sensor kinase